MPQKTNSTQGLSLTPANLISAAAVAFIAFAVFLPSLWNGFVFWDDQQYVYENPLIQSLDLEFVKTIFTTVQISNWHPLTMLSHAIDYALWGLNPLGHHLTNIIFHGVNTFLFFLIALKLGNAAKGTSSKTSLIMALVASLLFAIHPLHVESVAWVSGRKDVLSTFFIFLTVLCYLRYSSKRDAFNYATSLLLFALALMSKPMAVTLPVVLLILDFYPLENLNAKSIIEKIPFFILSAISSLATLLAQKSSAASLETIPFGWRILTAIKAYIFYLYKMLLPFGLAPYYPYPLEISLFSIEYIGSAIVLIGITVFSIVYLKRNKIFFAAWLFYLVTLLPVIGLIQVGAQAAADRYTYLPALGPFMLAGAATAFFAEKINRKAVAAGVIIISIALSLLSIKQIGVWKDSMTLWSHEVNVYPDTAALGYMNRAAVYSKAGEVEKSLEDLTKAISIKQDYKEAYFNRSIVYKELGRYDEAIGDLNAAIELNPKFARAYNNRGSLHKKLGAYEPAIKDYQKAIELSPQNASAYFNLCLAYYETGNMELALANARKAADLGLPQAAEFIRAQGF
ncbi:MAG: tetratricopeptide repeat protein [Deltaproteobacteria bacterium]|nr:tetratricopeptide repeat protein [Deltaproteobacteria bacterium]